MLWQGDEVTFKRHWHAVTRSTGWPVGVSTWHAKMSRTCFFFFFVFYTQDSQFEVQRRRGEINIPCGQYLVEKGSFHLLVGKHSCHQLRLSYKSNVLIWPPKQHHIHCFSPNQQKGHAGTWTVFKSILPSNAFSSPQFSEITPLWCHKGGLMPFLTTSSWPWH